MIAVDTSVAVAAALTWHDAHASARSVVIAERGLLLAPVLLETYSVLTRLPASRRVTGTVACGYLRETYAFPPIALSPAGYVRLLDDAAAGGITGGAVYDALVASTAREVGATLVTLDRRAGNTYDTVGVPYRLLT